jgi:prepilin-type N-terminal cleavage/methylation domain-containing protein
MRGSRPGRARRRARATQRGFSLVEVIVAMALIAIAMTLLATLAITVGRRGRTNELTTKRNLVLSQQLSRFQVMSVSDIAVQTSGTTQMLVGDFTFNRRLRISTPASGRYSITIVIEPIAGEFRADSVTIDRARMATGSPLCTIC